MQMLFTFYHMVLSFVTWESPVFLIKGVYWIPGPVVKVTYLNNGVSHVSQ